jgi:hypothetical protein
MYVDWMGVKILVHEKPTLRGTWSPHAVDGWYLGPAMLHYRCSRVWILETTSEQVADTVVWFPTKVSMPKSLSTDAAIAAARDLTNALLHLLLALPLSPISDSQHAALKQLSTIFHEITDLSPANSRLQKRSKRQQFLPDSSHCQCMSLLQHFQGCHHHPVLHHHPSLHHFQGC